MTFIEIVCVINLVVIIALCVIFSVNLSLSVKEEKARINNTYKNNTLLLGILKEVEKQVKEKGADKFSADEIYDCYFELSVYGATDREIEFAIDEIFN